MPFPMVESIAGAFLTHQKSQSRHTNPGEPRFISLAAQFCRCFSLLRAFLFPLTPMFSTSALSALIQEILHCCFKCIFLWNSNTLWGNGGVSHTGHMSFLRDLRDLERYFWMLSGFEFMLGVFWLKCKEQPGTACLSTFLFHQPGEFLSVEPGLSRTPHRQKILQTSQFCN